jgi:hypothetical protein
MSEQAVKKLFTVEEANQRLPLVRVIVQDIVDLFADIQNRRDCLADVLRRRGESCPGRLYTEELEQIEDDIRQDEGRLGAFINELHELGIEFKDPVRGLVDFPAELDGRVVYLCWQLGEADVRFWHELHSGFSGRQSLCAESVLGPVVGSTDVDNLEFPD